MTRKPKNTAGRFLRKSESLLVGKMKPFFVFSFLLLLVLALGGGWFLWQAKAVTGEPAYQTFVITKGLSANQVGAKLKEQNLIRSALAFKIYTQVTGITRAVQSGEYRLTASDNLFKITSSLAKGSFEITVTIPEGLRKEEVAQKCATTLGLDESQTTAFVDDFLAAAAGKEGYLFPDTYRFARNASGSAVVKIMLSTFDKKVTSQMRNDALTNGYDFEQVLVVASLIEREAKTETERPEVAGVLYNRLKAGWPLQVDATLQYVVASTKFKNTNLKFDRWWQPVLASDKEIRSAYNTYLNKGLPPTPICNPGLASIKAAVYPKTNDYWFYLHDRTGQIHFAKTVEEHNLNVKKYLF